ncbi:MAG: CYTH and CHAD domain-containing protein [Nocardioides sp.]
MLEIERKYDVDDGFVVPDLADLSGVASVSVPEEESLTATYLDTGDRTLLHAGITLRRRLGGHDEGWHLKLPATDVEDERHELQLPVGRSSTRVPQRFRTTLATLLDGRELGPVATVVTSRTRRLLLDADGSGLAEVVDDRVEATVPGAETLGWREVEVELGEGERTLLDRAERRLLAAGARVSEHHTKLARVLGEPTAAPGEPVRPHDPVSLLLRTRLESQVRALVLYDPLAREDLTDGVHAMRVATRRLRSALATGRPFLDHSVSEPLRAEIAWLADVLGAGRDAEVMLERLSTGLTAVADDGFDLADDPVVRRGVLSPLELRHRRAITDLNRALRSERYLALLRWLREVLADPPWTARAELTVRDGYRRRVAHDLRRLQRLMAVADAEVGDSDARSLTLHAARRAAKRARYAVEPLRPGYGRPADDLVRALKDLQAALGRRQDTVVTRTYLVGLTEPDHRPRLGSAAALVAGVIVERERADAETCEAEATSAWLAVRESAESFLQ